MIRLATGIDLIEIARVEALIERYGMRFMGRVYTPQELDECRGNVASLAARFAAKEAVSKALGTGIGPVGWQEIEILRGPAHQPILHLHGQALRLAGALGLSGWSVSLTHTQTHAAAVAAATAQVAGDLDPG